MSRAVVQLLVSILLFAGTAGAQAPTALKLKPATVTHPEEFSAITSVRELGDGRLLVTDPRERRMVVLDFGTGAARRVGREGRGPGEFIVPAPLHALAADSTLMFDLSGRRFLLLHRDSVVATIPPDDPAVQEASGWVAGADAQGRILTRSTAPPRDGVTEVTARDSLPVVLVARATGRTDTVARIRPLPRRNVVTRDAQGRIASASSTQVGILQVEEIPLLFTDGALAIVRADPFRVDWRSPAGRWTLGAPLPVPRIRIDARERAAYVERNKARYTPSANPGAPPPAKPPVAGEFPENLPPFVNGGAMAGPDGLLIVRRSSSADFTDSHYFIIDRQGRLLGELRLPATELVVGAGPRALYVSVRDEDDILRVRRHPW
ncbi:MAG: hypothetical protein KJZ74_11210 [Gemmatimonadales bacterium]|nr:hypothetical protein [Gemmatimonadales bacterium]